MISAFRTTMAALATILLVTLAPAQVPAPAWTTSAEAAAPQSVRLFVGEKKDIPISGSVGSLVVVDLAPVAAEVVSGVGLRLTGLALGESLVIAMTSRGRVTYDVEVIGRPSKPVVIRTVEEIKLTQNPNNGSITTSYSPALTGTHAVVRQRFEYTRTLGSDQTLQVSGELLKFFNRATLGPVPDASPAFGFNRVSIGIASSIGTLDMLDSTLQVSPLSLSGYTMRGLHFVAAPGTRFAGLDLFAGVARPEFGSIGGGEGWIYGAILPVARTDDWQFRIGAISIAPSGRNPSTQQFGGTILQMDALYAPSADTRFFSEIEYSNRGISGGAKLDLHRKAFDIAASFSRLDGASPLISIGAQGAGRTLVSAAFFWHPDLPFRAVASYTRSVQTAVLISRPDLGDPRDVEFATTPLANETLQFNASIDLPSRSQLTARFTRQRLDVLGSSGSAPYRLDTRTVGIGYSARFADRWSNRFDISVSSSREAGGNDVKKGLDIRDELRRSWKTGSASTFFRYLSDSESLVGIIIRNPSILPPELRTEYESDPSRFLASNAELLRSLFPGVSLPYRSRAEVGFRFQNTFSRLGISGETSYRRSGSGLGNEGGLTQSIGASFRLDAANDVQINASHTFAGGNAPSVSALTISYTYRFGAMAGTGFQFGHLFGLNKGLVRGRVYMDLNVNGVDETGEPGVADVTVALDGGRTATTDREGRFEFTVTDRGVHTVGLTPDSIGEVLRATSESEQQFSVGARATAEVSFGVTNYGSVGGRVYNDLALAGLLGKPLNNPGLAGVRVSLRRTLAGESLREAVTDASGGYIFSNLAPGPYVVEYDTATIPLDFQIGTASARPVTVVPLNPTYVDIPVAAERAIAGTVFRDRNGNGTFDERVDEPLSGARVSAGEYETTTGANGRYLLRHLPAAALTLRVVTSTAEVSALATIVLGPEPSVRRGVDLSVH